MKKLHEKQPAGGPAPEKDRGHENCMWRALSFVLMRLLVLLHWDLFARVGSPFQYPLPLRVQTIFKKINEAEVRELDSSDLFVA